MYLAYNTCKLQEWFENKSKKTEIERLATVGILCILKIQDAPTYACACSHAIRGGGYIVGTLHNINIASSVTKPQSKESRDIVVLCMQYADSFYLME